MSPYFYPLIFWNQSMNTFTRTIAILLLQSIIITSHASEKLDQLDAFQVIQEYDATIVKSLIEEKRIDVNASILLSDQIPYLLTSPLIVALSKNKTAIAKVLIEGGADVNRGYDEYLQSPLQCAVWELNVEMVQFLIEHNAQVNCKDEDQRTPLHTAALCGFLSHQDAPGNQADNQERKSNINSSHHSALERATEIISLLLEKNVIPLGALDTANKTALDYARENGYAQIEQLLLNAYQEHQELAPVGAQGIIVQR